MKPLFSDKSRIRDRISISEKGETLKTEPETIETINSFFSHIGQGHRAIGSFFMVCVCVYVCGCGWGGGGGRG